MKCSICETVCPDNHLFCHQCGSELKAKEIEKATQPENVQLELKELPNNLSSPSLENTEEFKKTVFKVNLLYIFGAAAALFTLIFFLVIEPQSQDQYSLRIGDNFVKDSKSVKILGTESNVLHPDPSVYLEFSSNYTFSTDHYTIVVDKVEDHQYETVARGTIPLDPNSSMHLQEMTLKNKGDYRITVFVDNQPVDVKEFTVK